MAHSGVAYSPSFLPLELPKKFHIVEFELVDCSFSLNQYLSPEKGSAQLKELCLFSGRSDAGELPVRSTLYKISGIY